jgi:tRNA nucleotidyltransferase (CCA-adding enzyme)
MDAFRRPERFEKFVVACEADARGRSGLEDAPYPQADYLRGALQSTIGVSANEYSKGDLSGAEIGQAIEDARIRALDYYKSKHQAPKK